VVWNPGVAAADIVDIGLAQQPGFVCVEAANTFLNNVQLQPGERHSMGTTLSILE
jgi:glucose-6-phosphate 1-epimerase